jgi:hypothetical protein
MGEDQADFVFPGSIQKKLNAGPFLEIIVGFINIDDGRQAARLIIWECRALLGCLGKKGDAEPPKKRAAFLLQEILGSVYQNNAAFVQRPEEIEPVLGVGEHPLNHPAFGQDSPEAH